MYTVYLVAVSILTSSSSRNSGSNGNFVGYSSTGMPMYSFADEHMQKSAHSLLPMLKSGMRQILEDKNSRSIFYFLLLNLVSGIQ